MGRTKRLNQFKNYGSNIVTSNVSDTYAMKPGDKVHATYSGSVRNGMIKRINHADQLVWVVFDCANNWSSFRSYSALPVPLEDIKSGWV